MAGKKTTARPHGQIRRSQMVGTFGPGAMIDLPEQAGIVGGLESWGDPKALGFQQIFEERLTRRLSDELGIPNLALYSPPIDTRDPHGPQTGVTVWLFPEWFIAQPKDAWTMDRSVRSRPLVHRRALVKGRYEGMKVVPMRFVQACTNGHISDIHWIEFVHGSVEACKKGRVRLWIDERGTSGDLSDVIIRCECGKSKPVRRAMPFGEESLPLGYCEGHRPWLGAGARESCGGEGTKRQPNKLLIRSASNAYFASLASAIAIPDGDEKLKKAVERVWEDLETAESVEDVTRERKKKKMAAALEGLSDVRVFAEVQRRRSGAGESSGGLKQAELMTLLGSEDALGEDAPEGDFYARALPLAADRPEPMKRVSRVVLVHRLREVVAQIGFTRFDAPARDIDQELTPDLRMAPLARELTWLPAVENRGEGVFLAFDRQAIDEWAKSDAVRAREKQLFDGFESWRRAHHKSKDRFPGVRYILLHSLSHLLITAVSLECGYAASSIRERIYASPAGYGILLYTGTPDSEGTLGGLVGVGKRMEHHLENALRMGTLCSNDPVCAQHHPDNPHEERFLHGAACHGCLLIAEPSCEWRNEFLDRALVVATVDVEDQGAEFFREPG
jgi:hypothetical protein